MSFKYCFIFQNINFVTTKKFISKLFFSHIMKLESLENAVLEISHELKNSELSDFNVSIFIEGEIKGVLISAYGISRKDYPGKLGDIYLTLDNHLFDEEHSHRYNSRTGNLAIKYIPKDQIRIPDIKPVKPYDKGLVREVIEYHNYLSHY